MSNIKSLKNIIENYSEELKYLSSSEIKNLQALLEDIKDRPKNIWDLKTEDGEEYYSIESDGKIIQYMFNEVFDEDTRDIGNAFLTREEAEFDVERRKVEAIMRKYSRPFKYNECNWYMEYFYPGEQIDIDWAYTYNPGVFCFESKEIAQMVVDEIGKDRLIKYWFGIK